VWVDNLPVPLARPTPASLTANEFAVRSSLALSGRQHQVRFRSSSFGPETDLKLDTRAGWPVARDWFVRLEGARCPRPVGRVKARTAREEVVEV